MNERGWVRVMEEEQNEKSLFRFCFLSFHISRSFGTVESTFPLLHAAIVAMLNGRQVSLSEKVSDDTGIAFNLDR